MSNRAFIASFNRSLFGGSAPRRGRRFRSGIGGARRPVFVVAPPVVRRNGRRRRTRRNSRRGNSRRLDRAMGLGLNAEERRNVGGCQFVKLKLSVKDGATDLETLNSKGELQPLGKWIRKNFVSARIASMELRSKYTKSDNAMSVDNSKLEIEMGSDDLFCEWYHLHNGADTGGKEDSVWMFTPPIEVSALEALLETARVECLGEHKLHIKMHYRQPSAMSRTGGVTGYTRDPVTGMDKDNRIGFKLH